MTSNNIRVLLCASTSNELFHLILTIISRELSIITIFNLQAQRRNVFISSARQYLCQEFEPSSLTLEYKLFTTVLLAGEKGVLIHAHSRREIAHSIILEGQNYCSESSPLYCYWMAVEIRGLRHRSHSIYSPLGTCLKKKIQSLFWFVQSLEKSNTKAILPRLSFVNQS